jgi:flagellar hook protein FlgE
MSLYGMMRTGVSGMAAQANRLSATADNIANADTTGYKRARTQFSSLVLPETPGGYSSGGVSTTIMNSISSQGVLQYTTSVTDLAVYGDGFFVVQDGSGTPYLTRAGAFVPDGDGHLVNAAGYQLLAYDYAKGIPAATVNGFEGLVPVTIVDDGITAAPSTAGVFTANLPSAADAADPAKTPSHNLPDTEYTSKSSLITYNNLGEKVLLDVYFTKTGANTWEVSVFDQSKATPGTSFPYTGGALANATLNFDGTTGKLTGATDSITVPVPGGASLDLSLSGMTQLATDYTVSRAVVNGNAPNGIKQVTIDTDGTVNAHYDDGTMKALYRIPLASVTSPDRLGSLPGNIYSESGESGSVRVGFAEEGSLGKIQSGALENSDVDVAEELTDMIAAQRSYTANSKVFQTGSELMDVLVNLKR